ncbi:MAG: metal-dependent hydrolase [Candidatus Bathyarchaeia archaeon]|jgi:membrane-bound metal-dependent hydrolase YbcI (DUF457 family)
MFAIGHFALGYLTGKATSKLAHVKINLPLLLAVSVIPDVDLLFSGFMDHRGLTHSLIVIGILSVPFFAKYKKAMLPYLAAILSHVFLGDLFTGGIEFLWPISKTSFGLALAVSSLPVSIIELALFFISLTVMYQQNDLQTLFKPANRNFFLIVCFGATVGPLFWYLQNVPGAISVLLIIPSIIWLCIFAYSLLIDLRFKLSVFANNRHQIKG